MSLSTVESYFESLKPAYDELLAWESAVRHPTLNHRVISAAALAVVLAAVGSLFPLFPWLITQGLLGAPLQIDALTVALFGVTWLASSVVSLAAAKYVVRLETRNVPSFQRPPLRLTRAQLAFLHAHLAVKALDSYFQSRLASSLQRAIGHANQLFGRQGLPPMRQRGDQYIVAQTAVRKKEKREFVIQVNPKELSRYQVLGTGWVWRIEEFSSALQLAKRGEWFELAPATLARLEALIQLPEKVMPRLLQTQDLPAVLEVLREFERFLFWTAQGDAPDLSESVEGTRKAQLIEAADSLATALNTLPPLPADPPSSGSELTAIARVRALMSLDRAVVRFVIWTVVCSTMAVVAALVVRVFLVVDDNTLATLIIPTAFTAAAALTVLTGKGRG